jgi:hypothetical protein
VPPLLQAKCAHTGYYFRNHHSPSIDIQGANSAAIHVGDTYTDFLSISEHVGRHNHRFDDSVTKPQRVLGAYCLLLPHKFTLRIK